MKAELELSVDPKPKDLGDNFSVRRALPTMKKRFVGPFVFWDHMGPVRFEPGAEMVVRAHPHIGLATITYLFSGNILHRDSLGNEQMIQPGEVNWMTAGRGIAHSERARMDHPDQELEGIQLWVALPADKEEVEPDFVHMKGDVLPAFDFQGATLTLIAGKFLDHESPVPVFSDLFYLSGTAPRNTTVDFELGSEQEAAVYIIQGKVEVEAESDVYERFNLLIFKQGTGVHFKCQEDCQFMIFGGTVFPEKRTMWWNFVSSSPERIEAAKLAWKNKEFPEVIHETDFIPLPDR